MKRKLTIATLIFLIFFSITAPAQLIITVAGDVTSAFSGDGGPATNASFNWPAAVAVDASGDLYIADMDNDVIREVNASGFITTVAGNTLIGYDGDGFTAEIAKLNNPTDVTFDTLGNLYIADQFNHLVRRVNDTGIISTYAGYQAPSSPYNPGPGAYSGDNGPAIAAQFYLPTGIAFDRANNLYITDMGNSVIRKVTPGGLITTIAGISLDTGYSGDNGQATTAKLNSPMGIKVDAAGNIYFADNFNNVIRKINTAGIITTVAGNGYHNGSGDHSGGNTGDGGPATAAELSRPTSIAIDTLGNLFIADQYNHVVRKVNTSGIISTFAGDGTAGFYGDGGSARFARLNFPNGVDVDRSGNLFIADMNNNVVRKVTAGSHSTAGVNNLPVPGNSLQIIENPNNGTFALKGVLGNGADQAAAITVLSAMGQVVYQNNIPMQNGNINVQITLDNNLPTGVYMLKVNAGDAMEASRFVVEK